MTKNKITHIAIDGNEANIINRVGSNVYAFEIIKNIYDLTQDRTDLKLTILLSSPQISELPEERANWTYQVVTPRKFWTQWALPLHLFANKASALQESKYDLLFTPGHYAPRISPISYVSSVMDLAFLKYPEQFKKRDLIQLTNWTRYSVHNAKKIITISEFSKKDIVKTYSKEAKDIVVAYPAVYTNQKSKKISTAAQKKILAKFKIKNPYILYVGTIQPRKNLIALIEAFEKTILKLPLKSGRTQIKDLQLVIAGKIGWLADDVLTRVKKSPRKENIILTDFVTEEEKKVLLENANCLSLIGLYEGFGIPPLEALHAGTIPVVSKTSSLPEVVGKAGILANPENSQDISHKLAEALSLNTKKKAIFKKEARQQIKKFDWKESAKIVLQTLEDLSDK